MILDIRSKLESFILDDVNGLVVKDLHGNPIAIFANWQSDTILISTVKDSNFQQDLLKLGYLPPEIKELKNE